MEMRTEAAMPQEEMGFAPVVPIGPDEIAEAERLLREYKSGKSMLEARIKEDDKWWRMRHFDAMNREDFGAQYPSAWLFNSIMGKHAAMMENYPEPNILPREQGDEQEAQTLSSIVPVIMEMNDFKETYSQVMWRKMQHGNGCYGVFWEKSKLNGLGDVNIVPMNIMNVFWEPGVRDIQLGRNFFSVEMVHEDDLRARYPGIDLGVDGDALSLTQYMTEDNEDMRGKRCVVDWYYKRNVNGVTELHLCKFVGRTILYSSENEGHAWYDDGKYPFVLDVLFPMEGSPAGFGFIDTGKYAQEQIDLINQAIITNALMGCRPRYFIREDGSINAAEFADWSKQLVHVEGMLDDMAVRPIDHKGLDGNYIEVMQSKIAELKETTSNQDVQTGASGGVTAASAIQALQESAGMPMKDATRGSYRAFEEVVRMVIERIRQFYDMPRMFRIIGDYGNAEFMPYDNAGLKPQPTMVNEMGQQEYRLPEFDIEVVAQSETQYTKLKNNEDIINLFNMGFFNPENVDISLMVMDVLDMPRKDKIIKHLEEFRTVHDKMAQYAQMAVALAQKYEPMLAQGLMQQAQMDLSGGQTGGQTAMGAPAQQMGAEPGKSQPKKEAETRERAANTTKPGV